ncbi:MAG TPA: hypothetical protein VKS21_09165 [Spirochaetota bacterium]|nr:hypothetical protein [Spirochaetota bacterium]
MKKSTNRGRARLLILFCLLTLPARLHSRTYAVLNLELKPERAAIILIRGAETNIEIKNGKNIIPSGEYTMVFKRKRYITVTNTFSLTAGATRKVTVTLQPAPFTLVINSPQPGFDLFFNSKKLLTTRTTNTVISNLPGGSHDLFLKKKDKYYFSIVNSLKNKVIKLTPSFTSLKKKVVFTSISAVWPGLNFLFHCPDSAMFLQLTDTVLFYSLTALNTVYIYKYHKLQKKKQSLEQTEADQSEINTVNRHIDEKLTKIKGFSAGMAVLSGLNILLAYNGIKNDQQSLLHRQTGLQISTRADSTAVTFFYKY